MISRATILAVGRLKGWADRGCADYLERLQRRFKVEVLEVAETDMNRLSKQKVLDTESERLTKKIPDGAYVISLDRASGKSLSSEKLAEKLESLGVSGRSHVVFVLGGALGLSREILDRSDERISLGEITLPHALARVVLLEQLYRAAKISGGEKYHW